MTAARRSGCRKSTEAPFGNVIENLAGFLMPMPKRQEISANLKTNALRKPQSSRAKEDPGDKTRPHWAFRRSRPPVPIDRDQGGAGAESAVG